MRPDGLRVDPAEDGDAAAVAALVQRAYREPAAGGWTTEAHLLNDQRITADQVRATIARPRAVVLVARAADGEIVGCCEVREQRPGLAYFGMFAVSPQHQTGGIGRRILAAAEQHAAGQWGAARMEMTVIGQRAEMIAWYERRGYRRAGERRPFPYDEIQGGVALRDDLYLEVLIKDL